MRSWLLAWAALIALHITFGNAVVARAQAPTVAVLYFDYAGSNLELEALQKGLAQMLIADLAGSAPVQVVERTRLEAVLSEHKLAASGKIDPVTAARVGKLLGARYLVLGSYFDVLKTFRVDARIVEVETGKIIKALGADGKADDFSCLEQRLAVGLREALTAIAAQQTTGKPAPATPSKTRPRRPAKLKAETALAYGKALNALDAGKKADAVTILQTVVTAQPDFELAALDLERLIQ